MSEYGITVDTGGGALSRGELAAFMRDAGRARAALASMKAGVRTLQGEIGGAARTATRGFARMAEGARGLLSAMMRAGSVARGLESGLNNLYRYGRGWWREFAGTMDGLAANALRLKNSLAAMAAPLISALAPAVDGMTERLVGLFNLVNQVFARLSGASTYVAARRNGAAWDAVSNGIGRADRALKRYLMRFDDLNVLGDGGVGDAGGSAGSGGGGAGVMFETLPIESGLADFADSLKAAFEAADWQALGTLLGEKLNALAEGVDWAGLGRKVGFYVNGLFGTTYWTLETVNFVNLGGRVAELLNAALSEIDFTTVGATVALIFASLAQTLAGFVEGFDWAGFAGKLADGVNGFVGKLAEKLGSIDWSGLALKLTEGLNRLIAGVDWAALGDWLNDTLVGALDFGLAFLNGFDAQGFASGVKQALDRVDWDGVAQKLWALFKAALTKLGEFFGALLFGGNSDLGVNLSLLKDGWTTVTAWLGIDEALKVLIALVKSRWTTIGAFVGTLVEVLISLGKNRWSTIAKYVGTAVKVLISLGKNKWSTIAKYIGTAVKVLIKLGKSGWSSIGRFVGEAVKVLIRLGKSGWTSISAFVGTAVTVSVTLANAIGGLSSFVQKIKEKVKEAVEAATKAEGGAITNSGHEIPFARGGVIRGSVARYLSGVPHYAGGTTRAHGTVFVAGEAGPEIMGHINGRTEILNKSQLADAMYAAVVAGMGKAVNALGRYLANQMAICANAITASIGNAGELAAVAGLRFSAPALASGTVLPYEVAAQVARSTVELQRTLDANNEDLIQTIISVAGQIVAAVQAQGNRAPATGSAGGMTARQIIDDINRQAQMLGSSPLLD